MDMAQSSRKICQSCGMPMKSDEDFGTEADGGRNEEYCHFCYMGGGFTNPKLTLKQQTEKLIGMAISQLNMSDDDARLWATNVLPNLRRWKS